MGEPASRDAYVTQALDGGGNVPTVEASATQALDDWDDVSVDEYEDENETSALST
jgi:hypothetical protein